MIGKGSPSSIGKGEGSGAKAGSASKSGVRPTGKPHVSTPKEDELMDALLFGAGTASDRAAAHRSLDGHSACTARSSASRSGWSSDWACWGPA